MIIKGLCLDVSDCFWLFYASKYKQRIEECVYIFENNYGIGIQGSDYVDFLMSYSNATHAGDTLDEYEGMQVDTSKEMLAAMFSFLMETRSRL